VEPSSVESSERTSTADSGTISSSATTVEPASNRPVDAADIFQITTQIWDTLANRTGREYHAIEYTGSENAKAALFVFGSTGIFVDVLESAVSQAEFENFGVITARLYRPWVGSQVLQAIPRSVEKIAVLEQARRTTKWGPTFLDLLSSISQPSGAAGTPRLVGYRYRTVNSAAGA
jgi:sulfite reductase (NADPH) hemoprotein beta-component